MLATGHINKDISMGRIVFLCFIFMLLPPVITFPAFIGWILSRKEVSRQYYILLFGIVGTYLACINATKTPAGDQLQYWAAYTNVPKIGFIKSLIYIYGFDLDQNRTMISGEFMNGVYNYIGYYLTFGYYPLFAALLTFANYMLVFLGLYKFCLTLKKPHIPMVCGVLILAFFYLYFQYILQIQKQFLGQSIMMYVLGNYAYYGKMSKKLWIMTVMAVFTHASTLLFVPFLIFKPLHRRLTKTGLLLIAGSFVALIIMGPSLAGNIVSGDNTSALTYGVSRLAQSEANNDIEESGLVLSQLIVVYLPLLLIVLRKLWMERKTLSDSNAFILNVVLLLLLTVMAMFRQPMAQYRYFMMLIAFMPFVYPFITNNVQWRNRILKGISIVMIAWFYYQFDKIVWHYAPEIDIIIKSPVMLLFGNYYTYTI